MSGNRDTQCPGRRRTLVAVGLAFAIATSPLAASDNIILSTASAATLGGLSFNEGDLVEYDPVADSATLYFDESLFGVSEEIDAAHVLDNGHIILSTAGPATLGGLSFDEGDLAEYDPVADSATLYFDGSLFGTTEDIDAVHVLDNGHIVLSTTAGATLGGLTYDSGDLAEYDPVADSATLYFDGSLFGSSEDIDAVHVLDNGHIVLSTVVNATLGGLSFDEGDLAEYDPVADSATLYFDQSLFGSNENIDAVHILETPPLSIVKRAFQMDGTPISSGSTLPKGMPVKFLMYINNPDGLVTDVSMRDVLDPLFLYVAGSTKYDNSVANCAAPTCTVAEEAALFAAADSGTAGTDAVDGDVVSFAGVTLDIGNQNVANAQLDIAGSKVWAVVFTIRMQ